MRNAVVAVVAVSVGVAVVLAPDPPPAPAPEEPPRPEASALPDDVVVVASELDDVLLLGLPFGFRDRGVLAHVDLAAGEVRREAHDGGRWPDGIAEPTALAEHPDAEAAARSPDGRHVAVFTRAERTRTTGVTIHTVGSEARPFHHLQSVGGVVGGRLAWAPDSEAVYLLASDEPGGSATRVVGIPMRLGAGAETVVVIRSPGWRWLAVDQPSTE